MYSIQEFMYVKELEQIAKTAKLHEKPIAKNKPKIEFKPNKEVIKKLKIHNQ